MNNAILFYYNLKPDKIINNNNYYYFYINNVMYHLITYYRNIEEAESIYKINNYMLSLGLPTHRIIMNKDNKIITYIDNIPYILYQINIPYNRNINLKDVGIITKSSYYNKDLARDNWDILWANRIDYLEYHINQNGKKYPIIVESFSYFVGMCENAISYIRNTYDEEKKEYTDNYVISHDKLIYNNNLYSLYDPLNIIIDHKSRDIAEYIKLSFFNDNFNIYEELEEYFKNNYYSRYGIRLLFGRILYPSFYLDMYDQIITNTIKEDKLFEIINRINEYEDYLKNIFIFLNKFYKIPEVEWLMKKTS